MHYPSIHESNRRGIHFMQGWCEFLGSALGVTLPLLTNRPHLYFDSPAPAYASYWVICAGGKRDFTNKLWGHTNYQAVVDMLKKSVRFVQVGGGKPSTPWRKEVAETQQDEHPRLEGVTDLVGKTSLRELFELVRGSRGVLCGVSLLMHVAAALEKPAVVIAGGREPVQWNSYPKQHYLHTVGALPCSDTTGQVGGACWRARVVPLGDGTVLDKSLCERPIEGIPECMRMIHPEEVAKLILRYNR
jgi:ADP-heptose:LPS heptosyltransferase